MDKTGESDFSPGGVGVVETSPSKNTTSASSYLLVTEDSSKSRRSFASRFSFGRKSASPMMMIATTPSPPLATGESFSDSEEVDHEGEGESSGGNNGNEEVSSSCVKEGWLEKERSVFHLFHRRYFRIKGSRLLSSKREQGSSSVVVLQLKGAVTAEVPSKTSGGRHCFQVISGERSVTLGAESRGSMEEWVEAVHNVASQSEGHNGNHPTHKREESVEAEGRVHKWRSQSHPRPIYCNVCRHPLSGVTSHGLSCDICRLKVHKGCAARAPSNCKWTTLNTMTSTNNAHCDFKSFQNEDGTILFQPHQWVEGNLPVTAKCAGCKKNCGSVLRLQDFRCLWCHSMAHESCISTLPATCEIKRISIIPPVDLLPPTPSSSPFPCPTPRVIPGRSPLLVLVNGRSGNHQGRRFLRKFRRLLNPAQVFDLSTTGPSPGLLLFSQFSRFRMIVCGGDGSVGWVLVTVDALQLQKYCQTGILPLGTGNDLSRVLGWGASMRDDADLELLLDRYEMATTKFLDRWSILTYERDLDTSDGESRRAGFKSQLIQFENNVVSSLLKVLRYPENIRPTAQYLTETVRELILFVGESSTNSSKLDEKCYFLSLSLQGFLQALKEREDMTVTTPMTTPIPPGGLQLQLIPGVEVMEEIELEKEAFSSLDQDLHDLDLNLEGGQGQGHDPTLLEKVKKVRVTLRKVVEEAEEKYEEEASSSTAVRPLRLTRAVQAWLLSPEVEREGDRGIIGDLGGSDLDPPPGEKGGTNGAFLSLPNEKGRKLSNASVSSATSSLPGEMEDEVAEDDLTYQDDRDLDPNPSDRDLFHIHETERGVFVDICPTIEVESPSSSSRKTPGGGDRDRDLRDLCQGDMSDDMELDLSSAQEEEESGCGADPYRDRDLDPCTATPSASSPGPLFPPGTVLRVEMSNPGSPIEIVIPPPKKNIPPPSSSQCSGVSGGEVSGSSPPPTPPKGSGGAGTSSTASNSLAERRRVLPIINPLVDHPSWPAISSGGAVSKGLMANANTIRAVTCPLLGLDINFQNEVLKERCVMNNYFGIGIDAKITLAFHLKREEEPEKCSSRSRNFLLYGLLGGKEFLQKSCKNLEQKVYLECDDIPIPLPRLQGIVILNIQSFMGGTNFWGGRKEDEVFLAPAYDDGVLEVVAVFNTVQMAASRIIRLQHHRIAQCRRVKLVICGNQPVPVQTDGEAWLQSPGVTWIVHKNSTEVLVRNKLESQLKSWGKKKAGEGKSRPTSSSNRRLKGLKSIFSSSSKSSKDEGEGGEGQPHPQDKEPE